MKFLNIDKLIEGDIIEYNNEKLQLIETAGESITFIEEADDDRNNGEYIDTDAKVFIRQRWLVIILPQDKFSKEFKTHRYINSYYTTYGKLLEEQGRIYTAYEIQNPNKISSNNLKDDYII